LLLPGGAKTPKILLMNKLLNTHNPSPKERKEASVKSYGNTYSNFPSGDDARRNAKENKAFKPAKRKKQIAYELDPLQVKPYDHH
jgi:hypothetical protein